MSIHFGSTASGRVAAACVVSCLGLSAQAQQAPISLGKELVITAGRIPQERSEALRSVVVITAQDIEASGQLTLTQVLQLYGGLEMTSNGGPGSSSAVFIRGANSAHTQVLVDGIRLQSATTGTTAFENIPLAQIERIEIVPGPLSGLYGSDAIGGVIQIFTKGAQGTPGMKASVSAGRYGTTSVGASLARTVGETAYSLSAARFETDGFDATKPTIAFGQHNPDKDGYDNTNFSARLTHQLARGHELGATALYSKGEAHFDGGPGNDDRTEQTLDSYTVHSRNQFTANWQSLLRLGTSRDDAANLGGDFPSAFRTDQDQVQWQNTFRLGPATVIAGLEYIEEKVATSNDFAVNRRTVRSAFGGVSGEHGSHGYQANVRRDDNSQYGEPTSGSLAYGYRFTPEARLRLGYGEAFHAPSFNDLYFPGFGNAQLRPEKSDNREIGFDYEAGTQRLAATYFDNRIADLIVFIFDPVTFEGMPVNVAKARIRGFEFAYQGRWFETAIRAKLTLQDPESRDSGFTLQRRARRHGSVIATREFGRTRVGAEIVASGARFDSANEAPASRLAGYALLNLTLAHRLGGDWSVDLRWNNVGDTKYELVRGYNTPGSNALLSLKWSPP